jgi:hypothetical protein
VPREDAGLASGILNTSRTVGAAVGLAALATVAANKTASALGSVNHIVSKATALTDGYNLALLIGAILLLASGLVALFGLYPAKTPLSAPVAIPEPEPETEALETA